MVGQDLAFPRMSRFTGRLTCRAPIPILSHTAPMMLPRKLTLFPVLVLVGSIFLIGAGCGGKTIQYPEDHERYLRIDRAVESLRHAYEKKDLSNLASLMMPIDQLERLREEAQGDFETFSAITLDFTVERIMIEGDDIDVFVHWQGLWKKDPDDPGLRQRGHTKLQWVGTQAILLRGVQGDAPFGMKARQATIDPTRSPTKK
ncbi:MAG: hypothetical protein SGJ16_13030 [Nitrospirota bacterium]|nr:hypothetical protein [Nitrospirota bacterium]